jgi:hypothetical protein
MNNSKILLTLYNIFTHFSLITRDIDEIITEIKKNGKFNNYLHLIDEESDATAEDYITAFQIRTEIEVLNYLEQIKEKTTNMQTVISKIMKLWEDYH